MAYKGNGRFVDRDESGRSLIFVAAGQDTRGGGGAQARVTAVLHSANGGASTLVKVAADLAIGGNAAQLGRGMIAEVSARLIKQFADSLAVTIAASSSAPAMPPAVEAQVRRAPMAAAFAREAVTVLVDEPAASVAEAPAPVSSLPPKIESVELSGAANDVAIEPIELLGQALAPTFEYALAEPAAQSPSRSSARSPRRPSCSPSQ